MTRKQIFIIIALIIFIAGGVIFGTLNKTNKNERDDNPSQISSLTDLKNSGEYFSSKTPEGAKATEPDKLFETPLKPGLIQEKIKIFEMNVSKNGYEPEDIVVKKGDTVEIKMSAVDGDYDLRIPVLGLYQTARKGETKSISFGVGTEGVFVFECRDFCPNEKIKGTLTVLP